MFTFTLPLRDHELYLTERERHRSWLFQTNFRSVRGFKICFSISVNTRINTFVEVDMRQQPSVEISIEGLRTEMFTE